MRKRLILVCLFAALLPAAPAQTRGGFGFGGFRNPGGFAAHRGHRFGARNSVWSADPFFYSDYPSQPAVYEPPVSPVVIVQPPSVATPASPSPEPLMIEWQGDKYVRFSGQRQSAARDYSETPSTARARVNKPALHSSAATRAASVELPPIVLAYPDGHREKVSDYAIVSP
jgi:hypothetical protein